MLSTKYEPEVYISFRTTLHVTGLSPDTISTVNHHN